LRAKTLENIDAVLAEIQQRWGQRIIQVARDYHLEIHTLSTGIEVLDGLLDGGLPIGKVAAFMGTPTSGITTLAYRVTAHSHATGAEVVFIDLPQTFNGGYAADCGVDLDRLLVARPPDLHVALDLTSEVVASRVVELVVLDLGQVSSKVALHRLHQSLVASPTVLLLLTSVPLQGTHVRLQVACRGWLRDERNVIGCTIQATVQQHPRVPVGRSACFDLYFGKGADYA